MESSSTFESRELHGRADRGDEQIGVMQVAEDVLKLLESSHRGSCSGDRLANWLQKVPKSFRADARRMRLRVVVRGSDLAELSAQCVQLYLDQGTEDLSE
jgi:hypothetical protein